MAETLQHVANGHMVVKTPNQKPGGMALNHHQNVTEPDAQEMVIASLRSQIQDLFSQVTQLNNKLVQSYDRVSDLEDDLHVASSNVRSSSLKISQLELERTQHISALNTGLLVEKSHVTAELNRLMEKATDEAAQRGQAESARADIEKDLDDLSATLFGQANTMVAEARYARSLSERKVEEAERALKGAEEVVGIMQHQMQALEAEKEKAEREAEEMRVNMGKGKWVERVSQKDDIAVSLRLLSSHTPYQDFLLFVAHLRSIHPTSPNIPAMSTLLPLPFLARLLAEDSDPTVRLDLAPSLNWLSRRTVLSAIHNGQLIIEPVSSITLLHEFSSTSYSNSTPMISSMNSSNTNISCALCGTPIFPVSDGHSGHSHTRPPTHPLSALTLVRGNSSNSASTTWSAASSLFKNPLTYSTNNSPPTTPSTPSPRQAHQVPALSHPQQVHVFRISPPPSSAQGVSTPTSFPLTLSPSMNLSAQHHSPGGQPNSTPSRTSQIYPLCPNGWCLTRLRTTCSLWAFVRTGVVEKIWEEEIPILPLPKAVREKEIGKDSGSAEKPPLPPRRRGLWGMASALGGRAASWTEGDKERPKEAEKTPERERRVPPPPPPTHPTSAKTTTGPAAAATPPPLPKRSQVRGQNLRSTTTPSLAGNELPAPVVNGTVPDDEDVGDSQKPETKVPETPVNGSQEISSPSTPKPDESTTSVADVSGAESESFLTPTEEPTSYPSLSPVKRTSASLVPLPESRPSTPVVVPATIIEKNQPEALATPSQTASPAPPPPLPRRAAARVPRPRSAAIIPDTHAPPPPDVHAPAPDTEITTAAVSDKEPGQNSGEVAAPPPPEETPQPTKVIQEPEPIPEPFANGEDLNAIPADDIDGKENETSTLASEHTEPETITASPIPAYTTISDDEKKAGSVSGDKEEDTEVYVGDATWEERSWKEVVKLREDMFWARIGALR